MTALPPIAPTVGLASRVRLGRDYYVRLDSNDYSVDPRMIGRLVDVRATPTQVIVTAPGQTGPAQVVADHARCWAHRVTVTDPAHVGVAKQLRSAFAIDRAARERAARHHPDGHQVTLRALPDYDALFGIDFTATPHPVVT